jgi:hypothetical protein
MVYKRIALLAAGVAAASMVLAGCGGGDDAAAPASSAPASAAASAGSGTPAPQATIDPSLAAQINVEDGSAPIPGAVDSVKQDKLSTACADAVAPVRAVMAKYKSGLLVTSDADNKALTDGVNKARTVCEKDNPQQWADFYAKEYFGWLNGDPKAK